MYQCDCQVIMKMIALTPRGYWQSRRNRGDMLVTLLGVVWMVLHYMCISVQCGDFSNSFGYVIVVLRFFTITGKHVRRYSAAGRSLRPSLRIPRLPF